MVLAALVLDNIQDELVEFRNVRVYLDPIQLQKNECSHGGDSLIAVDECVVLHEMKKICRRHFIKVRVKILTTEGGGRHRDSGFKEIDVPNAARPAVSRDLISMDFNDFVEA